MQAAPQPEIVEPNRSVSLTYRRTLEHLELQKRKAMERVSELSVVTMGIPERDAKGKIKMKDRVPVINERKVLERDAIAAKWDIHIDEWKESWEGVRG